MTWSRDPGTGNMKLNPTIRAKLRKMFSSRVDPEESLHSPVKSLSKGDFTEAEIKEMELSLSRTYGRDIKLPRYSASEVADNDNRPTALVVDDSRAASRKFTFGVTAKRGRK